MININSISLIAVALGLFFFFTKPFMADISALSDQKSVFESTLSDVKSIGEMQDALQAKVDALSEEEKKSIDTLMPDKPNMVKLIADIDAIGVRHGLAIDQISFLPSIANQGRSVAEATNPVAYDTNIITFSFSADYDDAKNFLLDLEKSMRLIDVRDVSSENPLTGSLYTYKVGVEIYSLKKQSN